MMGAPGGAFGRTWRQQLNRERRQFAAGAVFGFLCASALAMVGGFAAWWLL